MKQRLVDNEKEVCDSVMKWRTIPNSEWWNDEVNVVGGKKETAWKDVFCQICPLTTF